MGAALDLIADALYTLLSFGAFAYFKIVPAWFVLVLAVKLIEFLITSRLLGKKRRGAAGLVFDRIGKLSILLAMALPGAFVFRCVIDYRRVMGGAVYVIGALLVVSTAARIRSAIS